MNGEVTGGLNNLAKFYAGFMKGKARREEEERQGKYQQLMQKGIQSGQLEPSYSLTGESLTGEGVSIQASPPTRETTTVKTKDGAIYEYSPQTGDFKLLRKPPEGTNRYGRMSLEEYGERERQKRMAGQEQDVTGFFESGYEDASEKIHGGFLYSKMDNKEKALAEEFLPAYNEIRKGRGEAPVKFKKVQAGIDDPFGFGDYWVLEETETGEPEGRRILIKKGIEGTGTEGVGTEGLETGAFYEMNDGTTRKYLGNNKWSNPINRK